MSHSIGFLTCQKTPLLWLECSLWNLTLRVLCNCDVHKVQDPAGSVCRGSDHEVSAFKNGWTLLREWVSYGGDQFLTWMKLRTCLLPVLCLLALLSATMGWCTTKQLIRYYHAPGFPSPWHLDLSTSLPSIYYLFSDRAAESRSRKVYLASFQWGVWY